MKKIVAVFVVALIVFIAIGQQNKVSAQIPTTPQFYTSAYSHRFIYTSNPVVYEFSGLDATAEYVWSLATVDAGTGQTLNVFGELSAVGVTSTAWAAGAGVNGIDWPMDYTGPIQVFDNYTNTIGYHFLAPSVIDSTTPTAWETNTSNTLQDLKQVAGIDNHSNPCPNPAYGPENPDGWHHTFLPCSVQTQSGDYFILHYRMNIARIAAHDRIEFFEMPGTTSEMVISLTDHINCSDGGWITGITTLHTNSYMVVNTNGNSPFPFFEQDACISDYITHDNPFTHVWDLGAYNCIREDSANAFLSDCESPLLISNKHINLNITLADLGSLAGGTFSTFELGAEWGLRNVINQISAGSTQTLEFTSATSEIWDSYNGTYSVDSVVLGNLDTDVYAFIDKRSFAFITSATIGADIVQWTISPSGINSGGMTTTEARFTSIDGYSTVVTGQFTEDLISTMERLHLDSPLGNIAGLIGLLTIGMVVVGTWAIRQKIPANFHFFLQMIVYTGIGGMWVVWGFANQLTTIFYLGSLLLVVAFFWLTLKGGSQDEMV